MYKDKSELLQAIIKSIPYPSQISEIDLDLENQLRFTWRGDRFRVGLSGSVEQVEGVMLSGSNITIVLEELLKLNRR